MDEESAKNRIKELRLARGLTQEQLAEAVGTTKQQIGRLEASKRRLADHWVRKIARALECHPGELWAEMPAMTPKAEAMLRLFEGLSESQQDAIIGLANSMAEPSTVTGRKKRSNGE